jgi:hypothetical protein
MPVMVFYTAFFGSDRGKGWSETHVKQWPNEPDNLLATMTEFKALIDDKRRPLLGRDCRVEGLRVSYETAGGSIASSPYKYQPFKYPGNQREGSAPSVSAKARFGEATNAHFSDVHLRGFWDAVERDEQLDFESAAGLAWKALFDQYAAALVAGNYGWEGIDDATTRRGDVTGYTVGTDNRITFTIDIKEGPPLVLDPKPLLRARFAKLNASNSKLNREFTVTPESATTLKTVRRVAALPFTDDGTFIIPATTFRAYTGVQYVVLGRRAMGRPTGQSPAKAKAQPLG